MSFIAAKRTYSTNYLLSTNDDGHGFALPDEPLDGFYIDEGDWKGFVKSRQRSAQIEADKDSYLWDYRIEKFCKNILAGTSYDRVTPFIADREKAVRMLALEPRTRRGASLRAGLSGYFAKRRPMFALFVSFCRTGRPIHISVPCWCLGSRRCRSIPIGRFGASSLRHSSGSQNSSIPKL
jgi:hypothetical protein